MSCIFARNSNKIIWTTFLLLAAKGNAKCWQHSVLCNLSIKRCHWVLSRVHWVQICEWSSCHLWFCVSNYEERGVTWYEGFLLLISAAAFPRQWIVKEQKPPFADSLIQLGFGKVRMCKCTTLDACGREQPNSASCKLSVLFNGSGF